MASRKSRIFPRTAVAAAGSSDEHPPMTPPPAPAPASDTSEATTGRTSVDRIGIGITATGAIDIDSMRPGTRQRFLDALAKSKLPGSPAASAAPTPVSDEMRATASMACAALGMLLMAGARLAGYSEHDARLMLFTPHETDIVRDPAARVLQKYAGSFAYAEESALAAVLLTLVSQKFVSLKTAAAGGIPPVTSPPLDDAARVQ